MTRRLVLSVAPSTDGVVLTVDDGADHTTIGELTIAEDVALTLADDLTIAVEQRRRRRVA